MSQELFSRSNEQFEPFGVEHKTIAAIGGDNIQQRKEIQQQTGFRENIVTQVPIKTEFNVTPEKIVSSVDALRASSIEQRGSNTLVTIPDHANSIISNLSYFSNLGNLKIGQDALERAIQNENNQPIEQIIPMELRVLLPEHLLKSSDYEIALKALTKNGNELASNASKIRDQIHLENLRLEMARDESGQITNELKNFTLEFQPEDIVELLSGYNFIVESLVSIINQEIGNQIADQKSKYSVLYQVKNGRNAKNTDEDTKLSMLNKYLDRSVPSFNKINISRFLSEFDEAISKTAQKGSMTPEEYLAEHKNVSRVRDHLLIQAAEDKSLRNMMDLIAKDPKGYLNNDDSQSREESA